MTIFVKYYLLTMSNTIYVLSCTTYTCGACCDQGMDYETETDNITVTDCPKIIKCHIYEKLITLKEIRDEPIDSDGDSDSDSSSCIDDSWKGKHILVDDVAIAQIMLDCEFSCKLCVTGCSAKLYIEKWDPSSGKLL